MQKHRKEVDFREKSTFCARICRKKLLNSDDTDLADCF